MNLLQIGELTGRFSEDFVARSKELGINWRAIKNMRNMFAHDYGAMDMERVWMEWHHPGHRSQRDTPC